MAPEKNESVPVSVVITTHNRPEMAKRAIRSVLSQTYSPLEIIVVEDGSNSGIEEWLKKEGNRNIRYILHEENKGLAAARNTGLHIARGKYVAYLDDDDEWLPEKLAKQVNLFETIGKSVGVVYCGALIISHEGSIIGKNQPRLSGEIRRAIRENGLFTVPSSCLFLKEELEKVGGYDETVFTHVDHDIWLRLAQEGYSAEYVEKCLVKVHRHQEYKMTEDALARLRATQSFCDKWRAHLESWFGLREAQKYCSQFTGRVMAMLGRAFLDKGERRQSAKYYLLALRYDLARRDYYVGLVACVFGKGLNEWIVRIWKQFRGGKAEKNVQKKR